MTFRADFAPWTALFASSVARFDIFQENYGFAKKNYILNFINRTDRMKRTSKMGNLAARWRCFTHDGLIQHFQTVLGAET